jgi:glycosyltransferase involved in cell wall biosynthesis
MMSVNIANALNKQGVDSYLCATRKEGALKLKLNGNVEYVFLNKKMSFDISAILRLRSYIKSHKIDIIHAHSSSYFIASIVKFSLPNVKLIWHDHFGNSENLKERKLFPLRLFSKYFHAIISVNNLLKKWSENNLKAKDVYYLPNFASLSDTSQKTVLKGENGSRIVCLAGFRPQKDHQTLLSAFNIVVKKHEDLTLHLIGNHYNDIYIERIKLFIDKNNLSNKVFLYHNATDVKEILAQASIGVLSSVSEGLPVSLLEYGLAKLPVVVTDVGECGSVLNKGEFGLLVPPSDKNQFSLALVKMISDIDLRAKFSLDFNQHIIENYSEQKIIHKLLDIYKL